MGSSSIGDIVATVGLDTRKWYDEAAALGTSAKGLGSTLRGALSGGKLGAGFVGGIADIVAGGASGGLEGAASSMIGTLTSISTKLGPWGLAIGAGVGILGDQLIPKLFSSADGMNAFTRAIETNISALGREVTAAGAAIDSADRLAKLGKSGSPGDIAAASESSSLRISKLEAERDLVEKAYGEAVFAAVKAGGVRITDPARRGLFNAGGLVDDRVDYELDRSKLGDSAIANIDALKGRLSSLRRSVAVASSEKGAIDSLRPGAISREDSRLELAEIIRRAGEAQAIRDADPFRGSLNRINHIRGLVDDQFLDRGVGGAAANRIASDFRRTKEIDTTGLKNDAAIGGTAAGFSELQRILRGNEDAVRTSGDRQVQLLERIASAVEKGETGVDID